MFTSKSLFSEIVCPYLQTCVLPRCIFNHPTGKLSAPNETAAAQEGLDTSPDQETPRKKQKLDEGKEKQTSALVSIQHSKTSALSSARLTPDARPLKQSYAATRTISPPPLKRSTQTNVSPAPSGAPKTTPKTPVKTSAKAPAKAEGLNPRALKFPTPATHDMRFRLLRALHEQFVRLNTELAKDALDKEEHLVLSDQALITRALDIEEEAAASPSIYSNLVKNKVLLYKRMNVKAWMDERSKEIAAAKAKEAPKVVAKIVEPVKVIETGLLLEQEIAVMKRLQTHISALGHAGFITSPPTAAEIASALKGLEAAKGWEVCDRCSSRFQVFPDRRESDGALASGGACTYHPGKSYFPPRGPNEPPNSKREKRYRCCNEGVGESVGCTRGENHVFKISEPKRLAAVLDFECTPEDVGEGGEKHPVCVDGEMGYTTYGLELIRLTATRWPDSKALFDVLVKPVGLILDLNSRYSGVWPKDFATALPYTYSPSPEGTPPSPDEQPRPTPTGPPSPSKLKMVDSPAVARELLFKYLAPSTPLIGHGLENDLNAMRVIHPTIVDTALLFPHRAGLPFRHGLKALMSSLLGREIQVHGGMGENGATVTGTGGGEDGDVVGEGSKGGHDSKEDANAAGELVRYAIKEEWGRMRREGFVLDAEGRIKAPEGKAMFRSGGEVEADGTKILVGESSSGKKRSRDVVDE